MVKNSVSLPEESDDLSEDSVSDKTSMSRLSSTLVECATVFGGSPTGLYASGIRDLRFSNSSSSPSFFCTGASDTLGAK